MRQHCQLAGLSTVFLRLDSLRRARPVLSGRSRLPRDEIAG
ncbi:hypothetical protein [Methylobacterium sp. Leaf465]|nr:hypothetical protein [Methylobacterium sp. Leaf465]